MQIEETKRYKRIQKYAKLGVRLFNMCKIDPSEQIIIGYKIEPERMLVYVNLKIPNKRSGCFAFNVATWDENLFNRTLSRMTQFIANRLTKIEEVTLREFFSVAHESPSDMYAIKSTFDKEPSIKGTKSEVILELQDKCLMNASIVDIKQKDNWIIVSI